MKLLIVTQYFPPEVGAPQNRLFELAIRLVNEGVEVSVLTAMPNYPIGEVFEAYRGKDYVFEIMQGIEVHRASIYASSSKSISKRLLNYFSFVYSSYKIGKKKLNGKYDVVMCESPPLFLGLSAYQLAKRFQAKFIFNVSDLWPESAQVLGLVTNRLFLNLAYRLEKFLYQKADLVTGQTPGIIKNIKGRYPDVSTYWLPNGVDLSFFNPDTVAPRDLRKAYNFKERDIIILYAGILGHAQGLEIILKAAHRLKDQKHIKFLIVGSGPLKEDLIKMSHEYNLEQLYFMDILPKQEMPGLIKAVDVALVPLKKMKLFKGAIPSKIFENCAMKKMLLLGVDGEAKKLFIDQGKAGLFFEPENVDSLVEAIEKIIQKPELISHYGESGRKFVKEYFNRDDIANKFLFELKKLQNQKP